MHARKHIQRIQTQNPYAHNIIQTYINGQMHAYINEKNANRNKQLNTQVNDINRA